MITEEFFFAREQTIKEYQAKGYQEISTLFDEDAINQLKHAGLLQEKPFHVTSEMYAFTVTGKGKKFLRELKMMDIILVKPNKNKALQLIMQADD